MIVVIADDFTGAAELAGISLRYSLRVELFVDELMDSDADVLIVSADSRSLKKEEALAITNKIAKQALALKPAWIYKKIDSVLRGYVLEELQVQMQLMNNSDAFIMPANPSLGRTISGGRYYVQGQEIDKTGFTHDPEFPVQTSLVKEMLDNKVEVLKYTETIPAGIIVGEAVQKDDYTHWSAMAEGKVLAGAGDFFTALLDKEYKPVETGKAILQKPFLYVCGTAFNERKEYIRSLNNVSWMPEEMTNKWIEETTALLKEQGKRIVAISESGKPAGALRDEMAGMVKVLVDKAGLKELFIEGGSTAAAILAKMNITKLAPVNELARGVVRMKAGEIYITVKPGSYPLPAEVTGLIK